LDIVDTAAAAAAAGGGAVVIAKSHNQDIKRITGKEK
jgi:hypothetical protein